MASTSGKYLRTTINGTTLKGLVEWTIREVGDDLDATDAASNGTGQHDVGIIDPEIRVSGYHKLADGPFPTVRTGTILTTTILYANTNTSGANWTFDRLVVTECESSAAVRGQIRYSFTARNTENSTGTSSASYTGPTA